MAQKKKKSGPKKEQTIFTFWCGMILTIGTALIYAGNELIF